MNSNQEIILIDFFFFPFLDFVYLLLERGEGKEKERERNIDVQEIHQLVASSTPPTGDLAQNPGMCLDWELNQLSFGSQVGAQSIEPHQPGLDSFFFIPKLLYKDVS